MTDIRKPFLKSFTVNELMKFIDHYLEHKEILHMPGHPWEICDLLARFLGFGYSKLWSPEETEILIKNFPSLGAEKTSELLLLRTAFDCKQKADLLGLRTNVRQYQRGDSWTPSEIVILSKYYPVISAKVMVLLPGRTENACVNMAQKEGIAAPSPKSWTEDEIEILKTHYPEMGIQVGTLLPGRSVSSIRTMAQKTEISTPARKWTEKEDSIIRAKYPQMGPSVASLFHGRRSEGACHQRALALGLLLSNEKTNWSDRELEILRKHYPQMGRQVSDLLPGRTEQSCKSMAAKLGLAINQKVSTHKEKWSEDEIKILKESYPKMGSAVHKLLPNRSDEACEAMAYKLGISSGHKRKYAKWTVEEIDILKANYYKLGTSVVDLLPGRTAATCQSKASSLGLTDNISFWSEEEDEIMRLYYPKEGSAVIERLPGRSENSCLQRAYRLGLCRLKAADSVSDTDQQSVRDTAPAKSDSCQEEDIQSVGDSAEMISETEQIDPEENPDQEETSTMQFDMMQM